MKYAEIIIIEITNWYTTVIKLKGEFCYKMKNLYLFIQINFIPFKVIPFRYNALIPTFFSNRRNTC